MKKMILCGAVMMSLLSLQPVNAQSKVNVNVGSQPNWGPAGYDYVEYYYLPDIETYYYVPKHQFVHLNPAGKWVYSNGLPHAHKTYDLYSGYKVVINQPNAHHYFKTHKVKYKVYKGNHGQGNIKNSKDPKYKAHKIKTNGNGRGRGNH